MEAQDVNQENIQKLAELMRGIRFAMLTTVDDGTLRSRPMATQEVEFDGDVWFFTYGSSHKVDEVRGDQRINVSYADPEGNRFVSLSGRARLVRDKAKMAALWKPALKAWFPKGLDEPDIALLHVNAEKAEYWDAPSSFVATAISLVKSLATGKPGRPGENEKINLE